MKDANCTLPDGLTFNSLRGVDICSACAEEEDAPEDYFPQYEVDDTSSICYRVTCVNRVRGRRFEGSMLGPTGHIERMNVWTHLLGALLYLIYIVVRVLLPGAERETLSNTLVTVDSTCITVTFLVSSAYHVASANRYWSAVFRIGDYGGIYLGIASGYMADLSLSTLNLRDVPWQSVADLWFAMAAMVLFFVVRRVQLPVEKTRLAYLKDRCSLGLARSTNVDLEHSSLRAAAGVAMAFSWILAMPGGVSTLESDCSAVFVLSHVIGTLILVFGMALDNVLLYPDKWLKKKGERPGPCVCYSDREGCGGGWIMTSHAFWHIIAILSIVSTSAGMEYVIVNSEALLHQPAILSA